MLLSQPNSIWALAILVWASLANGIAISYCSPDNTAASDFSGVYAQFQSNGLCAGTCSDYAYAILQGAFCWCSDYAPPAAQQENTYDCNQQCPGYGADWCGSTSAGLFGYYQLNVTPSGTAAGSSSNLGSSSSVSTTPTTPASSLVPSSSLVSSFSLVPSSSTVQSSSNTFKVSSIIPALSSSSSTSISVAPTSSSSITSAPRPSSTPTQAYTSVTTVTGEVRTIVVTPTATSDPTLGQGATNSGGVSTGKVVGIVLGVALGLGLLIGLGVWFWLRRKHQNSSHASSENGHYGGEGDSVNRTTPSRQVSQMSSSGLLGKPTRIMTGGHGPSNNPRSADTSSSGFDRRSLGTDQRLNPMALYVHDEARLSSVSLQDNQDYSRQLRVANPDL